MIIIAKHRWYNKYLMPELVDPKNFIISRKRKKYKFALFHNSPLCFEFDEWDKSFVPDVIEVGAGNGRFAVELATRHPEQKFVALDVKGDRLQQGARLAEERKLANVRFVRARADQIDQLFAPDSLTAIWVTFPDPFPRKRSAGRRLTHPTFLKKYAHLLKGSTLSREDNLSDGVYRGAGRLYVKHDNRDFFCWSLEQLVEEMWVIKELSFDLHDSSLSEDYKIMTTYEQKWLSEGLATNFVSAQLP